MNDSKKIYAVSSSELSTTDVTSCRVYKKRWLILFIFCLYAISNRLQFILYSAIADILVEYYGISYQAAQWTSLIGVIEYLIFNIPGTYLLDKLGLRWTVIIGSIGTCIGSWIKVASIHPSRFWVLILGQGFAALFQVAVSPLPVKIAATWFAKDETSKACSIGIIGMMMSIVFGFLLSPLLVKRGSLEAIEEGLHKVAYTVAIFSSILLPIVLLFFSNAPPIPPSIAQSNIKNDKNKKSFIESLKSIFTNRSFGVFVFMFGIFNGAAFPIPIILNEIVLKHHPEATSDVGFIGALGVFSGLVGTYTFGFILDRFKRFRETTVMAFTLCVLALILFLTTVSLNIYFVYFTGALAGFMGIGITSIALVIGVELTYPEPEGTIGGLMLANAQICGLLFSLLYSYLFNHQSELVSDIIISSLLIVTLFLFFFVKFDLRRQNVEKKQIIKL